MPFPAQLVPGKRALSSPEGHAPAACDRGRDESREDLKLLHGKVSRGRNRHLPLLEASEPKGLLGLWLYPHLHELFSGDKSIVALLCECWKGLSS